MNIHNTEIAAKFNELADLLEIDDANPFRIRAYRNAARTIENFSHEITDLVAGGEDLSSLPGVGEDLAEKIEMIVKTGKLPVLEELGKKFPADLKLMLLIPGLGPKRVKQLYKGLGIKSIKELKAAIKAEKLRQLDGFGGKTEAKILAALKRFKGEQKRVRLADSERIVQPLLEFIKTIPQVQEAVVVGSYRRRRETVGDIDILVIAPTGADVIEQFTTYEEVTEIVSKGHTRSTVKLRLGVQVDVRVIAEASFGAALQYFTGSKAHNIAIRKLAVQKSLKINEYGVFKADKAIAGKTEAEVYKAIKLTYIEPELREDRGEIEAAKANKLPCLVTVADIKGDLHCHTIATDGQNTIAEIAVAAKRLGYEYIAITDHTKHLTIGHGLDPKQLIQQLKLIDQLNKKMNNFRILKSTECDILDNGSLDLPDYVLKELDITLCAIHYKFDLTRAKQTERVLRALDNPYFNIFAHPTGRLLSRRQPYEIDLEKIMYAAKERNCFLELNAQPDRLDLNDIHCKMAKEIGLKVAISTDAHSSNGLGNIRFGVAQARRGWLEPDDVINTRSWAKLKALLRRY